MSYDSPAHLARSVLLGRSPDGKAECDLVDEISKVVHQVEGTIIDLAQQIPEEVAKGVDRPTGRDNEAHDAERFLHMLAHFVTGGSHGACFTLEDLVQDDPPSGQANDEACPSFKETNFTHVAGSQHENRTDQQAPEHAPTNVGLHCREDQIEFNHLQWHGNRPPC